MKLLLEAIDHIEVRLRSDTSFDFTLLVGEPPDVIKSFRPLLLPAVIHMQTGLSASPDPTFVVLILMSRQSSLYKGGC